MMIGALLVAAALGADPIALPGAEAPVSPAEAPVALSADDLRLLREQLTAQRAELDALRAEVAGIKSAPIAEAGTTTSTDAPVIVRVGEVVDDVSSLGDDVRVEGHVLGDATSFGGDVHVASTGRVDGDATSFGGEVLVDAGGVVGGDRMTFAEDPAETPLAVGSILDSVRHRLVLLLSFAGAGVLVVGLVPNRVGRIASSIELHPLRSAVVGLIASGVLLVASVLFAVTIVGLPVSFLLLAVIGLAWLTGFVGLCQAIGDRLPFAEKQHGRWLAFLVGTLVVSFAGALPWVGWLVVLAGSAIGAGGAFRSRFGGR